MECPQYVLNDGTPCNFEAKYQPLSFTAKQEVRSENYSYVVFKRRKDGEQNIDNHSPRLVRPTLVRSGHTICRMCTNKGKLQELIFTKSKHEK